MSLDTIKQLFNTKTEINPRLKTIACLARAFNVSVADLFNPNPTSFSSPSRTTNFSKYVGDYDAIHYSLDGNKLFNGIFRISKNSVNQNILEAELILSNKKYTGTLYIIFESNSAYSALVDTESKNVKIISFKMDTSFRGNSILGLMLCFDNSGMPVVQRILFVKKKLNALNNDNYHNIISSQLLMNNDKIYITKENLNKLYNIDNIPDTTKKSLEQAQKRLEQAQNNNSSIFYEIPESEITFPDSQSEYKVISHIRTLSNAPVAHRISLVVQGFINNLFK